MHTSAFHSLHNENKRLERANDQLQREVAARDNHIQQLVATLQQRDRAIVNLNMSVAALLYVSRPEAPRRRGLKRLARNRAHARQDHGAITIPKVLIDEIAASPFLFEARQTRDPNTGDVTMAVRRRSVAEISELEVQVQREQAAAVEAARKQQEEQAEAEAASRVVAPDGRPAREAEKSKILVVQ